MKIKLLSMLCNKFPVALLIVVILVMTTGCDSVPTESLPATSTTVRSYTGPAPATSDVQAFMVNVWENLRPSNRCGGCHVAGGQSPSFVRQDDINLAYAEAISLANLSSPADSRFVTKVAGGHNCWESSDSVCGATMTAYISKWAGVIGASGGTIIDLVAPTIKSAGATKNFPTDSTLFASTVYPILTQYCSGCHTESASTPQSPFFASSDVDRAYEVVRASQKIDLDSPSNSRLVVRLRGEFHNCWTHNIPGTSDCEASAQDMEAAILAFSSGIPVTQIDPDLVVSNALILTDGIVASGGNRYDANVIALYEFKTGSGSAVFDTSGVEPALHLTLSGQEDTDYRWVGGWGVEFVAAKAQGSTSASKKISEHVKATGEYSIEAWVTPGNVTQEGPARIVSYSAGTMARNFTLGQTLYTYNYLHRSTTTNGNGEVALSTSDADEDLQATLQHVVATFDQINGRRIYVNGVFTDDVDSVTAGAVSDWDTSFAFVLGNEVSGDRPWKGTLRLVAIHSRSLTQEQVKQNFDAGVGEKFYLLFGVTALTGIPDSYVLFEVSQFDSYSYLFNKPTFISLNPSAVLANIPLRAVRIGINGREASVGQAYRNIDTNLDASKYIPGIGQILSSLGTVLALEKGPQSDEFFLTFEQIGANTNVVTEPVQLQLATVGGGIPVSDIGLRTFDEINTTMSVVTGIAKTDSNVRATFDTIKQQLPTVESIEGFLSAHQVAVSQLAIEYCNALVEDSVRRATFFPGFDFSVSANLAFDTAGKRSLVLTPILDGFVGINITSQPDRQDLETEFNTLIIRLASCGTACDANRTKAVVKGVCAATLGSASMLLQ